MRDMTAMTVSSVPATPVVGSGDEARTTTAALRVEVLSDWSAVDAIEREWDELAERSDAEISSCPAYARVWWKHYGRGRLAIVVCRAAERIVGVLPMFIQRIGPWPVGVKVARLIGCDSTIAVMSPAIDAAWTTEAVRSTVAELLQHHGCDVVHLGAIQGDTLHADAMRAAGNAAAEASSPRFNVLERSIGVFTRWDLPASFEDYTARSTSRTAAT